MSTERTLVSPLLSLDYPVGRWYPSPVRRPTWDLSGSDVGHDGNHDAADDPSEAKVWLRSSRFVAKPEVTAWLFLDRLRS
jgi:hypothetical protein